MQEPDSIYREHPILVGARKCLEILFPDEGVPLFQEQVLRMAMDVAGFTGAEADELRRAMSFKRDDSRMESVIPVKVAGMVICRQRPGTAKGHCFISLEDENRHR